MLRGTKEFNTDAIELSISVSAKANRKAGKKLPRKAEIMIHFHSFFVIIFKVCQAKAKIIIDEKIILKDPNCVGLRPIKAFFIRINELPHIIDKLIRYNHFFIYFFSKKRIQSN